jgi:hypothetical protein
MKTSPFILLLGYFLQSTRTVAPYSHRHIFLAAVQLTVFMRRKAVDQLFYFKGPKINPFNEQVYFKFLPLDLGMNGVHSKIQK